MHIWVDADACPAVIKDILFRVAERLQLNVTLVANRLIRVPGSRFTRALQVPVGADAADAEIVERVSPGDIVVTGDIPLASLVLEKGGLPLNPRGEWYTKDTIAQQLTMRAFMEELRGSGVDTGGPAASRIPIVNRHPGYTIIHSSFFGKRYRLSARVAFAVM
ncbi:MAG TPA: YaiI/YqxD family protein [Noviherbaspirillum sp.]|nr:YaiI/YqxD family protein [Noviherbaspirillum sp.]